MVGHQSLAPLRCDGAGALPFRSVRHALGATRTVRLAATISRLAESAGTRLLSDLASDWCRRLDSVFVSHHSTRVWKTLCAFRARRDDSALGC